MRIPRQFTVKGKTWTVKYKTDLTDDDGSGCFGLCDLDNRTIYLEKTLKPWKRHKIFLHELFHVLVYEAHINPGSRFSGGVEEVLSDAFADLLLTLFKPLKWKHHK